jgi:hypothetical protein
MEIRVRTRSRTARSLPISRSIEWLRSCPVGPVGDTSWYCRGATVSHTLFQLSSDSQLGFTQVTYRGTRFAIHTDEERDAIAPRNHSLQALSLLNELISAAKVSSYIPNSQEIQSVP